MKKILYIIGMMVAVASCTKDDTAALGGSEVVAFSTETTTSRVTTSGTTSTWEAGDAIGIVCTEMGANYKYTAAQAGDYTSFNAASSDAQFLVSRDATSTERTYYAYYPYQEGEYYTSDVRDQSDLEAIDLLMASATTQSTSTETVEFSFTHRLAMVNFEISGLESIATLEGATVTLFSEHAIIEYNFDGTERDKNSGTITLNTEYDSASGKLTASGIVNARDGYSQWCTFKIVDAAGSIFNTTSAEFFFAPANIYNYTVTIGADGVDFTEGDITPWGTDNQGDWTADAGDIVLGDDGFYEIYTAAGLRAFGDLANYGGSNINGRLMKSVDISGSEWTPIYNYGGEFDGNGKRIFGLTITGSETCRGLFGSTYYAKIHDLGVEGSVSGGAYVGGIVGQAGTDTIISNCYFSGRVTAANNFIGGIAGKLERASVINCYSKGIVSGEAQVGGVVGYLEYDSSTLTNCYSASVVSASYSTLGGVTAYNDGSISNCYYDSTVNSSFADMDGVTPKTTEEMKSSDLLTLLNDAAVTYNTEETREIEACEWIAGLDGYPTLNFGAEPTYSKDIELNSDGVYQIYSAAGFREFADKVNGGYYYINGKLMCNIDLGGVDAEGNGVAENAFTPIRSTNSIYTAYRGTFDGGGYCISGLYINNSSSDYIGLFGHIYNSEIKNLGVDGIVIGNQYVGGIVGSADSDDYSKITNCYNLATVQGGYTYIGGLVGCTASDSSSSAVEITGCYNEGAVTGTATYGAGSSVGGIVGNANIVTSSISNCYNRGAITTNGVSGKAGGIVGHYYNHYGTERISNCYNAGSISATTTFNRGGIMASCYQSIETLVTNCYNNSSCTPYCYNNGSTGYTTGNMTESQMTGGSFAETLNSTTTDVWEEDTTGINDGYPVLSWQIK